MGECRVPAVAAVSPAEASILPAFNDLRLLRLVDQAAISAAGVREFNVRTSAPAAAVLNVLISAAAVPASYTCPAKAEAACKSAVDRRSATAARSRVPTLPAAARVQASGAAEFRIVCRMPAQARFDPARFDPAQGARENACPVLPAASDQPQGAVPQRSPVSDHRAPAQGARASAFPMPAKRAIVPAQEAQARASRPTRVRRGTTISRTNSVSCKTIGATVIGIRGPAPTAGKSITSASGVPTVIGDTPALGDPTADTSDTRPASDRTALTESREAGAPGRDRPAIGRALGAVGTTAMVPAGATVAGITCGINIPSAWHSAAPCGA